jgi:hypothetical protein
MRDAENEVVNQDQSIIRQRIEAIKRNRTSGSAMHTFVS